MQYKPLGRSGLIVSELCLGTMIFGDDTRGADEPTAIRLIHQFLDAGGNFVDTADVYVGGYSEEITGKALQDRRDHVVLATKVRGRMSDDPNDVGLSRRHIIAGCEASLRRLGTDYVDLFYAHLWDPITPIEETLRAFDDLVTTGKVRYIGVSNFKAWEVMNSLGVSDSHGWARFIAAQYQYSLVVRDIEREFVPLFEAEGLGLTPWGPLGGGFLSGKYRPGDRPTEGRIAITPDFAEEACREYSQRAGSAAPPSATGPSSTSWARSPRREARVTRRSPWPAASTRSGLAARSAGRRSAHHRRPHAGPIGRQPGRRRLGTDR